MPPTSLGKWLKKVTPDDAGLTRPPAVVRVSSHKHEVRSIAQGYFQSQFRVTVYKEVVRPTHDSIKRERALTKVTNAFWTVHHPRRHKPTDKLPNRTDVEDWWMRNEYDINMWSEHVTHKLVRQGESILRIVSLTGSGRYLANGCETGSVLGLR